MNQRSLPPQIRAQGVTAILGPTNTGKTYFAIERMVAHGSGMIGLPLRLLAREVYQRIVERVGVKKVALITGEEKIKPDSPSYWVCTVEAMPRDLKLAFVAIDEVQLAADPDRGHVFTDRVLNQRGREETLLLGSDIIRPLLEKLIPGIHIASRPRLSNLSYGGAKKISRLPPRSAIVAFSVEDVYEVAELVRRQKGGAAVVLGALSPRTRNAQVELYQSGEVDYIVSTDAIGMGLNLDIHHVAFASDRKFDGFRFRSLYPAEMAQIAGRAGRYLHDGTFGTTGRCPFLDDEMIEAIENHKFDSLHVLQWRNSDLDFSTLDSLRKSLEITPDERGLTRALLREDVLSLEQLSQDDSIRDMAKTRSSVERLWETCSIPDYRKVSPQAHTDLVRTIFLFLMQKKTIPSNWFKKQISTLDRVDGDLDTLSNRISQVRTWSFVANHPNWLRDSVYWQMVTRQVEDSLSDALHQQLAQRFIDHRTSVLLRRLRENKMLEAEISASGEVIVEGQHIGTLSGFCFTPDATAAQEEVRTLRLAAQNVLANEMQSRANLFAETADSNLVLSNDGAIRWMGEPVAKLEAGEKILEPRFRLMVDETLTGAALEKVQTRLTAWLKAYIVRQLEPLFQLERATDIEGIARGIAFQLFEGLGILERAKVLQDVRNLEQEGRASLRRLGVRFGGYHLFLPALLKPVPRLLAAQLWALFNGGLEQKGLADIAHLANSGRTSFPLDPEIAVGLYRAAGFRLCGNRALRIDILERLADLIRPAIAFRPGATPGTPPPGAADGDAFVATVAMTSLVGCAGEDFAEILRSLGYVSEMRAGDAITMPLVALAPTLALNQISELHHVMPLNEPVADVVQVLSSEAETSIQVENLGNESGEISLSNDQLDLVNQLAAQSFSEQIPGDGDLNQNTSEVSSEFTTEVVLLSETSELMEAGQGNIQESGVENPQTQEPQMIEVWLQQKRTFTNRPPRSRAPTTPSDRQKHFSSRNKQPEGQNQFSSEKTGDKSSEPGHTVVGTEAVSNVDVGAQQPQRTHPRDHSRREKDKGQSREFHKNRDHKGKHDGKRRGNAPLAQSFPPPKKEQGPDLDSPFAKLLALKEQLKDGKNK